MFTLKTGLAAATTLAAATASANTCVSSVSWSDPRVDVFGLAADSSIWHKFYTGWDWQPEKQFERLHTPSASCPVTSSWGEGRFDIFYVNASGGNVLHKFYGGGHWQPSWEDVEDLGGHVESTSLAAVSWGDNRLDLVAKSGDSFVHKAWTGTEWFPSTKEWEGFGGSFASDPAVSSWGPGRLDIIGISKDGSIQHKFWHEGWSKWEDLGGGPFIGTPRVTSWGPGRLDIWAVNEKKELNHLYWDGSQYQGWETLGGNFETTPQVVHWNATKIDIVGKQGTTYRLKNYDGSQWNPSTDDWYSLATDLASEPSVIARRKTNFLSIFGIGQDNTLRTQIWTGYDWQPGSSSTWNLGDLSKPYETAEMPPKPAVAMDLGEL